MKSNISDIQIPKPIEVPDGAVLTDFDIDDESDLQWIMQRKALAGDMAAAQALAMWLLLDQIREIKDLIK